MAVRPGWDRSIVGGRGGDATPGSCLGDQAMATQRAGQALDERGEHGPVRPVQPRSRVGAAKHGDFVAQHEELDVLAADVRPGSRTNPSTCRKIK